MIRLKKYTIPEVLDFVDLKAPRIPMPQKEYSGVFVKMLSDRYTCFKVKGTKCDECGIEGQYFWLEKHEYANADSGRYHFNLYAVDKDGNEVLMTKDHIIPKSWGGESSIRNYRTLCCQCNKEKDDKWVNPVPT